MMMVCGCLTSLSRLFKSYQDDDRQYREALCNEMLYSHIPVGLDKGGYPVNIFLIFP